MLNRLFRLFLVAAAAAGGVAIWQRRNETPPLDPGELRRLRPSEPFMDPAAEATTATVVAVEATDDPVVQPAAKPASIRPAEMDTTELPTVAAEPVQAPLPSPPHRPFSTAPAGEPDDLKLISGIGPKLEQTLNDEGITTFAQLAALDDAEVDALQARLGGVAGRVRRENWVQQAAELAG